MDIGKELVRLQKQVTTLQRSPRLTHASIEDTAVQVYDAVGSLRGIIGVQADGTTAVNVVNGAAPPQPSDPIVASVLGGVTVSWDGQFTGGSALPLDWSRVEVHAAITPVYEPIPATLQGTIETSQGATVVVPCDAPVYVRLVARNTSGTASTPSGTIGPYGPTPVVADDIVDGIVTTAKIAAGAVNINALTASLASTAAMRYVDAMGDPTAWTVLTGAAGSTFTFLTGVTDAPTGPTVGQATGYNVIRGNIQIPYDPDVLYRVSVRVRTTAASVSGTDTLYLGALGIAADGVTMVNRSGANSYYTQHYPAASNASQPSASGWVVYTGYLKARASSGTVGTSPDPRTPGSVHTDVRFISPLMYLNFGSGTSGSTGTMQVDAVTIEALKTGVVDSTNLIAGSVTTAALAADSVTATQIAANAVTASEIAAGSVTTGKLAAGAVTANEIAANTIVAGNLAAGSVDATAIAATAITGKTITGGTITGSLIQTAASGQRITLNEASGNKILVYNSAGTAIGELSANGLLVKGTNGSILQLDPNATYPNLKLTNAAGTNSAVMNVVGPNAFMGLNSGLFTSGAVTDWKWRTILGSDGTNEVWGAERVRDSNTNTYLGGRILLDSTHAVIGFSDSSGASPENYLRLYSALSQFISSRLEVYAPASSSSSFYLQADAGQTGYLLRINVGAAADKFTVDKDGNVTAAGTVTGASVSTTTGLTAATGFAINNFYGYRDGKTVALDMYINRSGGTVTATTGNITPDLQIATVPSGWRPTHTTINGIWDDGTSYGGFVIGTDGIVTLRTASSDITSGRNLRLHIVFIQD